MMAGPSNDKCSRSVVCNDDPPPLSITLKELGDLPKKVKHWDTDYSPVDILLLTVEDCEFLACHHVVSKNEEVCHKRQPRRRTTTVHTVHVSLIIFPRSHFPGCIFLHKQPLS